MNVFNFLQDVGILVERIVSMACVMPPHIPADCRRLIGKLMCYHPNKRHTLKVRNHLYVFSSRARLNDDGKILKILI